jgi:hypothetical protein
MGTGEGAQAYGWWHYVAENPGVAKSYRAQLADNSAFIKWSDDNSEAFDAYRQDVINLNPDQPVSQWNPADDIRRIQDGKMPVNTKVSDDAVRAIREAPRAPTGHIYEYDIPDEEIEKMLDWDAPLSEQPWFRDVKEMAAEYKAQGKQPDALAHVIAKANARDGGRVTGKQFYEGMLSQFDGSQQKVSEFLNEAGIPGIKYFDGSSRSAQEGTRNLVLFEPESIIRQVKRDGDVVYEKSKLYEIKPSTRKEAMEYEGRLFGGAYSHGHLSRAAKDAPVRTIIKQARSRYNELRQTSGLPPVTDWTKTPDSLVQRAFDPSGKPKSKLEEVMELVDKY